MTGKEKAMLWWKNLSESHKSESVRKIFPEKEFDDEVITDFYIEQMFICVCKHWTREVYMNDLGFKIISDDGVYAKYENKAGYKGTFYGKMGEGKIIIYFNRLYVIHKEEYIYCQIRDDGDTRTVFNGGISTGKELELILKLIM